MIDELAQSGGEASRARSRTLARRRSLRYSDAEDAPRESTRRRRETRTRLGIARRRTPLRLVVPKKELGSAWAEQTAIRSARWSGRGRMYGLHTGAACSYVHHRRVLAVALPPPGYRVSRERSFRKARPANRPASASPPDRK